MRLTNKLLSYLNRVFDKNPQRVLALRLSYDGDMTWRVENGILSTTVVGGTGVDLTVDLTGYRIVDLVNFLAAQPGYTVLYLDGSDVQRLSARALIDGESSIAVSNGDHLYAYTSPLWAYLEAVGPELDLAEQQIGQMLRQMSTRTAEGIWLDEIGGYYGIPRTIVKLLTPGRYQYPLSAVSSVISQPGTYIDGAGVLQTAPANTPRFEAGQLLVEGATTNLQVRSEEFENAIWSKASVNVTANSIAAPNGVVSADKLVEFATNTPHYLSQSYSVASGQMYTQSVFAKAAERTVLQIVFTTVFGVNIIGAFDLSSGVCSFSGGAQTSVEMTPLAGGWFRCSLSAITTSAGAVGPQIRLASIYTTTPSTYSGDGTSGLHIWGAQFVAQASAASYIPTAASAVTRAADIVSVSDPEVDALYGPRIITEVLRPRGNNVAMEAAIAAFTGQAAHVTDVVVFDGLTPAYNALITHNSAQTHNSVSRPEYGLFDVIVGFDLLGADTPDVFLAAAREVVDRIRDAGTHLRSLSLAGAEITDSVSAPVDDAGVNLVVDAALTDTVTEPNETVVIAVNMTALIDASDAPVDGDLDLTITRNYLHNASRTYNGSIPHEGGVSAETLS
jgi:hypothetical protein